MQKPGLLKRDTAKPHIWILALLVLLTIEKMIQHVAVTLAFILNISNIRGTVALDFRFFLLAGSAEALLFALAGWGILRKQPWANGLLMILALMDIVGEFVAQGTLLINLNVSFLVAVVLLGVTLVYRQINRP